VKLSQALEILQKAPADGGEEINVFLACGCTPLHLETFLTAWLRMRLPESQIVVNHGLYGDLVGNLERMLSAVPHAGAVVLEWSDFDPRLGIRSLGGWGPGDLSDILDTASEQADRIKEAIVRTAQAVPLAICLPSLPLPPVSYESGGQAGAFDLRLRNCLGAFSAQVVEESNVKIVNPQRLDRMSPPDERLDVKADLLSGFPYRLPHASTMAELLVSLIGPPVVKKGLITDLDDTLWRGLLGEVGVDGISWNLDHHSHIYGLYQQLLRSLSETGVLVAVASKNDPDLVELAMQREDLLLPQDYLFPKEIHWGPKSKSVERILKVWNIGADSVVFIDDSPLELAEVKAAHPEVECLLFPTDQAQAAYGLLERLRDLFGKDVLSEEDSVRAESIRQAAKFQGDNEDMAGLSEHFLKQTQGEITASFRKEPLDPRALDLVNKTNQFNLNGRRLVEGAWRAKLAKPESFLLLVAYKDKYGPLGKIAVLSGCLRGTALSVDTWVMSCRAFSRRIEHKCLDLLFSQFGVEEIVFDYRPTPRNGQIQEFFAIFNGPATGEEFRLSKALFDQHCPQLFHEVRELAIA